MCSVCYHNVKSNNAKVPSILKKYYEYVLFLQEVINTPPVFLRFILTYCRTDSKPISRWFTVYVYLIEDSPLMFFLSMSSLVSCLILAPTNSHFLGHCKAGSRFCYSALLLIYSGAFRLLCTSY